eukprot:5273840-Prymnesium_polylepis.1
MTRCVVHDRALQTTGATLMRHAYYTQKTWTPRYGPRGVAPCRNVTSRQPAGAWVRSVQS